MNIFYDFIVYNNFYLIMSNLTWFFTAHMHQRAGLGIRLGFDNLGLPDYFDLLLLD